MRTDDTEDIVAAATSQLVNLVFQESLSVDRKAEFLLKGPEATRRAGGEEESFHGGILLFSMALESPKTLP